jgi:lysophospholipase L1-like esterase
MAGDVGCRQSDDAYPWVVTRTLEREYGVQVNFDGHFFACSGATATTDLPVQVTQLKNYLLEHPPGEGSLIVVSITIGAGDLGWADPDTFYNRLYRANNNQFIRWADRRIADVEAELNRQLGALLMASPDLIVILTDVYNPFSPELESVFFDGPGKTCINPSAIPIYTDCYLKTDYAINSLNTALESTANQSQFSGRVHFVEIHEQFKGHEAPQPWCGLGGTGPNIGTTWIQYPAQGAPFDSNWFPPRSIRTDPRFQANDWTTGDCFHPNYEGAEVIANTVVNRIVQALQP